MARGVAAVAFAVIGLLVGPTPADAAPIRYQFSGLASGSVDGTPFRDALTTLTALADTSSVADTGPTVHTVDAAVRINIEGVGAGAVLTATRLFSSNLSPDATVIGVRLSEDGGAVVLFDPLPGLPGYDLRSAAGPSFVDEPLIEAGVHAGVPTEFGTLRLEDFGRLSFSATLPVPEPCALGALMPALLALRRRRATPAKA
jgi:hypothetical protein